MALRVAVVGSGISGLGAAWLLARRHDVHLFEASDRVGGHTHTVLVERNPGGRPVSARSATGLREDQGRATAPLAVDTGFIIYNRTTYPYLSRLFERLGVESRGTDMSFSVACEACDLEYAGLGLGGLLAQPTNALRPSFLRMVADIARFGAREGGPAVPTDPPVANGSGGDRPGREPRSVPRPARSGRRGTRRPRRHNDVGDSLTLVDFLDREPYGPEFRDHYLVPMAAALWSSGTGTVDRFPVPALLSFFRDHGLLRLRERLQWRTVRGGSVRYVRAMTRDLDGRIHLRSPVRRVERRTGGVRLHFDRGARAFDAVVLAVHADEALALLADPTPTERDLLSPWEYSVNDTWLHTDSSVLPARRRARASWNYALRDCARPGHAVTASYHMNRLQGLDEPAEYVVTLNPLRPIPPRRVLARMRYAHPIYTPESVATQSELDSLNDGRVGWGTFFCGAYFGYGFHEDGLRSAVRVAEQLDVGMP